MREIWGSQNVTFTKCEQSGAAAKERRSAITEALVKSLMVKLIFHSPHFEMQSMAWLEHCGPKRRG